MVVVVPGWTSNEGLFHSRENVPQYFRTLTVVNNSPQPVVLLDICGIPNLTSIFVLHDDYGLAHHFHPRSHYSHDPKGVVLKTRSQYQVTVVSTTLPSVT